MTGVESLRLGFAFGLGVATFFAPCAFPLLPGYVAYFLGRSGSGDSAPATAFERAGRASAVAGFTSLGFFVVYVVLAGIVFSLGTRILENVSVLELVVGILLIGLGSAMVLGKPPIPGGNLALPERRRGPVAYLGFGVVYAAAAAGCTAPLFVAVAGLAVASGPIGAVAVVGAYAAGMTVLLVTVTLLTAFGRDTVLKRVIPDPGTLRRVAGGVLIVAGIVQLYYYVVVFDGLASL